MGLSIRIHLEIVWKVELILPLFSKVIKKIVFLIFPLFLSSIIRFFVFHGDFRGVWI